MRIRNVTNRVILISDLSGPPGSVGLCVPPFGSVLIYSRDAERSRQLGSLISSGAIVMVSNEEPGGGSPQAATNSTFVGGGPVTVSGAPGAGLVAVLTDASHAVWAPGGGTQGPQGSQGPQGQQGGGGGSQGPQGSQGSPGVIPPTVINWVRYGPVSYSQFALTPNVLLFNVIPNGIIHAVKVVHQAAFIGPGVTSYTVSVGVPGLPAKYASAFDVHQAPGDSVGQLSLNLSQESQSSSIPVYASASSNVSLGSATQGSVEVWVAWAVSI